MRDLRVSSTRSRAITQLKLSSIAKARSRHVLRSVSRDDHFEHRRRTDGEREQLVAARGPFSTGPSGQEIPERISNRGRREVPPDAQRCTLCARIRRCASGRCTTIGSTDDASSDRDTQPSETAETSYAMRESIKRLTYVREASHKQMNAQCMTKPYVSETEARRRLRVESAAARVRSFGFQILQGRKSRSTTINKYT